MGANGRRIRLGSIGPSPSLTGPWDQSLAGVRFALCKRYGGIADASEDVSSSTCRVLIHAHYTGGVLWITKVAFSPSLCHSYLH